MSKVAIDCEMIQDYYNRNMLARVSLVNENGNQILYDEYVKPQRPVSSYREDITGLNAHTLTNKGKNFSQVQSDVRNLIRGKKLVGHSVNIDLEALGLSHPSDDIIDVAELPKFKTAGGQKRNLKDLAWEHLNLRIQEGYHDSVEDAKASMRLYKKYNH